MAAKKCGFRSFLSRILVLYCIKSGVNCILLVFPSMTSPLIPLLTSIFSEEGRTASPEFAHRELGGRALVLDLEASAPFSQYFGSGEISLF